MSRYIDADALIEALQADFDREGAKADDMAMRGLTDVSVKYSHGQFCFLNAIEQVKITPTADVVPKSEVELRGGSFYFNLEEAMERGEQLMREHDAEVARKIFEDIKARSMYDFPKMYYTISRMALDELEKKYMEGE